MKVCEKFEGLVEFDKYKLWDPTHPLEFLVGLDDKGRKTFVLVNSSKPDDLKKTSAIDVDSAKIDVNTYRLSFHLNDSSMEGIFYKFCDDIVESTRAVFDANIGMTLVCRRYNLWKKLFYKLKKNLLSENEQMGLIGELLFLRDDMFKNYDHQKAIDSWSGCDKTHKDFSVDDDWYEIKSPSVSSPSVKISSIEQLDSDKPGMLVVYEMEKMSGAYNGLTLNNVVHSVLAILEPDEETILIEKLKVAGWEENEEYDKTCFRNVTKNYYVVNDDFPRIKKNNLPLAVIDVEYKILKRDLVNHIVKK